MPREPSHGFSSIGEIFLLTFPFIDCDPHDSMITHRRNRGRLRPLSSLRASEDWRDNWLARAPRERQ